MTRRLVIFGLSMSSSWGNGHAIPFRALSRELAARGWAVTFFEQDVEWYRSNRDLTHPEYCELRFYDGWRDVQGDAADCIRAADAVLIGSFVADGAALLDWLASLGRPLLFYDIDTPITLTGLNHDRRTPYLRADQVPVFQTYLSFTGGPALVELEHVWGAQRAEAMYCAVDPLAYHPAPTDVRFECELGYMGTYAADRQIRLEHLLIDTARARPAEQFIIAGPQYPRMDLPPNVRREVHVYPRDHAAFYSSNVATLNLTRDAMRAYGWSPASRIFEAAACGACIISDNWPGLADVLRPGSEILIAETRADLEAHLDALTPDRRAGIGQAALRRVLSEHTFADRAAQLEAALERAMSSGRGLSAAGRRRLVG